MNIEAQIAGKQLIGYGGGLATLATIRTSRLKLSFIVDDNRELQGQMISGVVIKSPECLMEVDKRSSLIIVFAYTGKAIRAIQSRLHSLGFEYLENWIDCSCLHFATMKTRLYDSLGIAVDANLFAKVRILSLYSAIENQSAIAGTWLFGELLKNVYRKVPGGIAEMGVYQGGNAFISLLTFGDTLGNRLYHLFDSFTGFPEFSKYDPSSRKHEFADVSLSSVKNLFSNFCNVRLHVGIFSETLGQVSSEDFGLVYIDCDLYESTLECCEFFYPRLNQGGIILFDDYCKPETDLPIGTKVPFTGVKKAVDDFFSGLPEKVIEFPETTHALIIKDSGLT